MQKSTIDRIAEEKLYNVVVEEIKRDEKREGLWVKAVAEANGNKDLAQALYIKLRVQSLKDEIEVAQYTESEVGERISENLSNKPSSFPKPLIYILGLLLIVWLVLE